MSLSVVLLVGALAPFAQTGLGVRPTPALAAARHGKNTFHPQPDLGAEVLDPNALAKLRGTHIQQGTPPTPTTTPASPTPSRALMPPADLPLLPGQPAHFQSSDKRLTVDVPAGAVTAATVTQGGGRVWLHVTQIAGPAGGAASGHVSLGTYGFALMGTGGPLVGGTLARPITESLRYAPWAGAGFNLDSVQLIVDGLSPSGAVLGATGKGQAGPKATHSHVTADLKRQTLTATFPLTAVPLPDGSLVNASATTWNTDSPEAAWTPPTDTSVDLPSGSLSYGYPLAVPPGPGGLTPPVQLGYSSEAEGEQHNPQAAAGWVGEGWDLALGSITWGEENVTAGCTLASCDPSTCQNMSCATWQNVWHFSDPFGDGGELLPPDIKTSIWYDDSGNKTFPPAGNAPAAYTWHLAPESRIKVVSFTNPNASTADFPSNWYPVLPPCFRAWLPNGIMEEFGCTTDSLQFYVNEAPATPNEQSIPRNYIYRWDLDMIADAAGNQIHITYDQTRALSPASDWNTNFPIDAVPDNITYDSPSCRSTTTRCGSTWAPLVQIKFLSSNAVGHVYPSGQSCAPWASNKYPAITSGNLPITMRCDDAHDLYWPGTGQNPGDAAPTLQPLSVLNDVQVQITQSGTSPTWELLRDYQLSYKQIPATMTTDPVSGLQESVAGALLLTRIQEIGDDDATTLPSLTMSYTGEAETYIDLYSPTPPASGAGCGPTWNATLCLMWSETHNAYFLDQLDNGRGWTETYTWAVAHNNTHGVPSGQTKEDPLVCNSEMTTAPCYLADDENWSRIVLTKRQASVLCVTASGGGCGSSGSQTLTSTWSYLYTLTDLTAVQCVSTSQYPYSCPVGMYWGDINDGDYLDYYNAVFMGFATATVTDPDGSIHYSAYYTTLGWGLWSTSVIGCASYSGVCDNSPWTSPSNALHGHMKEELDYSSAWSLQREQTSFYAVTCPPTGVAASPNGIYTGQLSAELDQKGNPIVDCEIVTTQDNVYLVDGGSTTTAPLLTTGYTYSRDNAGHLSEVNTTPTSNDGGALGSPTTSVQVAENIWDDNVSVSGTSASGTYLVAVPAYSMVEPSDGSVREACMLRSYDGHGYTIGSYSGLTKGQETTEDHYTGQCGTSSNGWTYTGKAETTAAYDAFGNLLTTNDADANAGVSGHTGCTNGSTQTLYTACAGFDGNFGTLLIWTKNALNQISHENYQLTPSQWGTTNGWGQWLPSQTDANGQTTTFAYDPLGRLVSTTLPAETSGDTSSQDAYPVTCAATGPQEPCVALAATRRLDGLQAGDTVTSATYYDGWGRPVETVTPAPGGSGGTCDFTVSYTLYNPQGQASFTSQPYFTSASCPGGTNPPPYFEPDTTQAGASVTYDALGRTLATTDALNATTSTSYAQAQPQGANVSDTAYYEQTTVTDANGHKSAVLTDALGRETYAEAYTGNGGSVPYALYATTASVYDLLGDVISVTGPNAGAAGLATSAQMTATYDVSGRQTGLSDADLGTGWAYSYDQNGNVLQSVDPRGAAGTVYLGYDGLNRQLWRNTTNSPTEAYVTYSYDSTAGGNHGVGRLTGETFNPGASLGAGSYAYSFDARGQVTGTTTVLDGGTYPLGFGYNDAGMPTTTTYSDGEVATLGYTPEGWLTSLATTPSGGSATTLVGSIAYAGAAGAAMMPTAATVANSTYSFTASYDGDLRNTDEKLATGGGTTVYEQTHGYDAVGNVTTADTTLPAGTDNQTFCYDDEDRLVWASGATGTGPCGAANTAGTLGAAAYAQSFTYDALDRMTTGPAGSFTYGPGMQAGSGAAPLHGVTALGAASYSYDAGGDRTDAGATTGDVYDAERRLVSWTAGGVSGKEAYDGEGQRVAHQTTSGVTTTTTYYVGGVEEIDAASGTVTKYYPAPDGLPQAVRVGSTLSYLARDGLGSVGAALDGNGNVTATALYAPYGQARYSTGTMPTTMSFTGQRADTASGLDYYGARYYDPTTDQFASADPVADGLDRFAYVGNSPESRTDPSGHRMTDGPTIGTPPTWWDSFTQWVQNGWNTVAPVLDPIFHFNQAQKEGRVFQDPNASLQARGAAFGDVALIAASDAMLFDGVGEGIDAVSLGVRALLDGGEDVAADAGTQAVGDAAGDAGGGGGGGGGDVGGGGGDGGDAGSGGGGCSFRADTPVATPSGSIAIARLKVGDEVVAYDPKTGAAEPEPVEHVWVNHDHDLVDVRLKTSDTGAVRTTTGASARTQTRGGPPSMRQALLAGLLGLAVAALMSVSPSVSGVAAHPPAGHGETVHTTANHPWLTADRGWMPAGQLRPDESVVTLGGATNTVAWVRTIPGQSTMYNLTVARKHTFAVGADRWVVHNTCGSPVPAGDPSYAPAVQSIADAGDVAAQAGKPAAVVFEVGGTRIGVSSGKAIDGFLGPATMFPGRGLGGGCAEFICTEVARYGGVRGYDLDLFLYHEARIPPCPSCRQVLQNWANYNGAPITVYWLNRAGTLLSQTWRPLLLGG